MSTGTKEKGEKRAKEEEEIGDKEMEKEEKKENEKEVVSSGPTKECVEEFLRLIREYNGGSTEDAGSALDSLGVFLKQGFELDAIGENYSGNAVIIALYVDSVQLLKLFLTHGMCNMCARCKV